MPFVLNTCTVPVPKAQHTLIRVLLSTVLQCIKLLIKRPDGFPGNTKENGGANAENFGCAAENIRQTGCTQKIGLFASLRIKHSFSHNASRVALEK